MRVLHVFKTAMPESFGGVEYYIDQLCRALRARGVDSDVFTLSDIANPRTIDYHGYKIHRAKRTFTIASTGFSLQSISRFKDVVKEYDIVHYHFPWPFMDILHYLTPIDKPVVVSYHSDIVKQKNLMHFYKPIMSGFLRRADAILVSSENYYKSSSVLSDYGDKISIEPYFFDPDSIPTPDPKRVQEIKEKYGQKFFLFMGVLRYYKGLEFAIEAVRGTDLQLVIAGDGPMFSKLRAQSKDLDNVSFVGKLSAKEKSNFFEASTGFVFPSHLRSESFGISLIEASYFGKPMITCEIGTGTSYVNLDKVTGICVNPKSSQELREAMTALSSQQELSKEYGANARARFHKYFSAKEKPENIINIYKQLFFVHQAGEAVYSS